MPAEQVLQHRYLTVTEYAALWRCSAASVYRRVARGELNAVRLGSGPSAPIRIPNLSAAQAASVTRSSASS